ncbi:MAG: ABC transporter substrate-binding protein [Clostridia bacterium]|nr:ABC transporter substrate-binding protein [Clostridia bacterium]
MKKAIALILSLVLCLSMFAGVASADSKGKVYWLNFKPESDADLQEIAAQYTQLTGVPVKVVTAAAGTYESTLTSEMDKTDAPTLFVVGNAAAVNTWGDYCYDLTGTAIANELNTDAYNLYDKDGKLCSIGYCYECFGIIVNKALLAKAGYSIDQITNFESLKAIAEDIHARANELGFDAFTSSGMDSSSSWRFSGHLANTDLYYESVADGWQAGPCPATITGAYLDNYKNLWDLYINNSSVDPAALATGGFDAEGEFLAEKAVFYQNGSWTYSACSALGDENIAMIPFYCGVEGEEMAGLNCGTENCWAVNSEASEEDIQATLDFMYWLVTTEEVSAKLNNTLGVMPYKNAAVSTNKFLADANAYANAGHYTMTWAFNFTPNVDTWRAALVAAMNIYDADQTDANWANVRTAFVEGWAAQYAAANG